MTLHAATTSSPHSRLGKIVVWLAAVAYIVGIAALGADFQKIRKWHVRSAQQVLADGSLKPARLSFFSRTSDAQPSATLALSFGSPKDGEQWALFLPRLTPDVRVTLNDTEIYRGWLSVSAHQINRPIFIELPSELLHPQSDNTLKLQLHGRGPSLLMSSFYLGPQALLEGTYRHFDFFRHDLIRIALTVSLMLALFIGTAWWVRPRFAEYGWFSLAFFAFSYYLVYFTIDQANDYYAWLTWTFLAARAVFIVAILCFVHRFLELSRRRLECGLAVLYGLVFSVGLALLYRDGLSTFLSLTYVTSLPLTLLSIAYTCLLLGRELKRVGHVYLHWLFAGSLLGLLLGLHDVMVLLNVQHWLFQDFFVAHYASLFMAVGFGGVLIHRLSKALFNSEDLNQELQRLLGIKARELATLATQRLAEQREFTRHEERQRILSDVHDGVGGQLVSLLSAHREQPLDAQSMTRELDQILADLRLILDALSPAGDDLLAALARLRERYAPLLQRAGFRLHWHVSEDVAELPLLPGKTINVLRVVQEAIQNSLRHSHAKNIELTLIRQQSGYRLTIGDDGDARIADPEWAAGKGYGIANMQRRAEALSGNLKVTRGERGGTEVALFFPVAAADSKLEATTRSDDPQIIG